MFPGTPGLILLEDGERATQKRFKTCEKAGGKKKKKPVMEQRRTMVAKPKTGKRKKKNWRVIERDTGGKRWVLKCQPSAEPEMSGPQIRKKNQRRKKGYLRAGARGGWEKYGEWLSCSEAKVMLKRQLGSASKILGGGKLEKKQKKGEQIKADDQKTLQTAKKTELWKLADKECGGAKQGQT